MRVEWNVKVRYPGAAPAFPRIAQPPDSRLNAIISDGHSGKKQNSGRKRAGHMSEVTERLAQQGGHSGSADEIVGAHGISPPRLRAGQMLPTAVAFNRPRHERPFCHFS